MSDVRLRIDKWLWYARVFKTRTLAASVCKSGKVRVNGETILKAHVSLKIGDVITFKRGPQVGVLKVLALGSRRGPAVEAQTLYEDLTPPTTASDADKCSRHATESVREEPQPARPGSKGRPTKRDRRAIDRWHQGT